VGRRLNRGSACQIPEILVSSGHSEQIEVEQVLSFFVSAREVSVYGIDWDKLIPFLVQGSSLFSVVVVVVVPARPFHLAA
jgi:hypothetical protein